MATVVHSAAKDFAEAKVAYIEWEDACSREGWNYNDTSTLNLLPVKSAGLVLVDDKEKIVITIGIASHGGYMETIAIPKGMIRKKRIIKL